MNNTRIKHFIISPDLIMMLGSGKYEVVANPLPADAEMNRTYFDEGKRAIVIEVSSETFEPVLWGETIPILESPVIRKLNQEESKNET